MIEFGKDVTMGDIKWIAGFFEGEGYFKTVGSTFVIEVSQVQKWPLE